MTKSIYSDKQKEARRVSDEEAAKLVASGAWKYITKNDFKRIMAGQTHAPAG